jgi:lipopolysaccharide export system protein LptA
MFRSRNSLLLSIFISLHTPACFAERADSDQPLHLESDQVLIDNAKKISTFTGNVQLTQGTMFIRGDKIVVTQDKDGFKRGTIYGKTASFRQKRQGMNEYVEGNGERIEYDTRSEAVDLYGQAHVKRGLDDVRGEHITYNIRTELFQVNSGDKGTANTPPKRVRAVLQPKPKNNPATPSPPDALPNNSGNTPSPAQ